MPLFTPRSRPVCIGVIALLIAWLLAGAGYVASRAAKPTAAKAQAFINQLDFDRLSPSQRVESLGLLIGRLNALPADEWRIWEDQESRQPFYKRLSLLEKGRLALASAPIAMRNSTGDFGAPLEGGPGARANAPQGRPRRPRW